MRVEPGLQLSYTIFVMERRRSPARVSGWLAALFALSLAPYAHAQSLPTPPVVTPPVTPPSAPTPKAKHPKAAKPVTTPLLVMMSVVATSPDPPWLLRIENAGPVTIRIPADSRLLRFEMKASKGGTKKCAPPKAMVPSSFPDSRELFLRPGEVYEEEIDPRLYCFGDTTDLLRPGTVLIPHFGFGTSWGAPKEPFVAQATDYADPFTPLKDIKGPELTLPAVPAPPPPAPPQVPAGQDPLAPLGSGIDPKDSPPPRTPAAPTSTPKKDGAATDDDGADAPTDGDAPPPAVVDKNAGYLDIYVSRLVDAGSPRDVVLTIRAKNEGRRKLAGVLRSRMLHFKVEEVGADNRTLREVMCTHQEAAHGIATEAVSQVGPGKEITIPILVSEICPRGTFSKPGLYRVTGVLDTSQVGESLKADPWLGHALARQSALVRLATAKEDFYYASARTGPAHLPPGVMLAAEDPTDAPAPPPPPKDQKPPQPPTVVAPQNKQPDPT